MIHRVSDFSLFNSNILLLSHNNVTPEVPEELPPPPVFGIPVHPVPTRGWRGADYARHFTTAPLPQIFGWYGVSGLIFRDSCKR